MKGTAEEIVSLYRYVHHNGPVTFDQIATDEKALPPAMRHTAYAKFRAHRAAEGEELPDEWFKIERNKDLAWRWWVAQVVEACRDRKRFSVSTASGEPVTRYTPQSKKLYSVRTPPRVLTQAGKSVPWTPEFDLTYKRAVAGQRVVQRAEQAMAKAAAIPDKKDRDYVIEVLKDALEAIRVAP